MIGGMRIEKGAAALAQLPARDQSLVRALGMVHDAWMATLSALSDGGAGDAELDMTIMSAATDLWRAMKRTHSAIEALEMERMLASGEGPETEDISAARGDLSEAEHEANIRALEDAHERDDFGPGADGYAGRYGQRLADGPRYPR